MIITREVISKNILFEDRDNPSGNKCYTYDELSKEIDLYKNFLIDIGAKKDESVLIGFAPSIDQLALFFAVCELGLNFVVNDYKRADRFQDWNLIDSKTKILSPIHYFFHYDNGMPAHNFFKKICNRYISIDEVKDYNNYAPNDLILCEDDQVIMKCTSSGSTGTPKKVLHTHEFLYNVSKRNAKFYDGTVGLAFNFNHGSSLATYFLPGLMSADTIKFVNVNIFMGPDLRDMSELDIMVSDLNHFMIPYFYFLERFLDNFEVPELTYYTLTPIDSKYRDNYNFKDVISFFGCNETSGPIFINNIRAKDFKTERYYKIDDFYRIDDYESLKVYLNEYDVVISTEDKFDKIDNVTFDFKGKDNFLRINGELIPEKVYREIIKEFIDADPIYDTVYNRIYLAIWDNKYNNKEVLSKVNVINDKILNLTNHCHSISKFKKLDKRDFVLGVKLDHELLRCYFREKVEEYAKV